MEEDPLDRVKIGEFIRRGINLKGVLHVGTNDGYEIQWYLKLGLKVIGFEPLERMAALCRLKYPEAQIFDVGLGNENGKKTLMETWSEAQESSGGTSFLKEKQAIEHIEIKKHYNVKVSKGLSFITDHQDILWEDYDCLVIDVQGMELDVLKGFGYWLKHIKAINCECSRVPWYDGEASAQEVIDYLATYGFSPITDIFDHDDILFVKNDDFELDRAKACRIDDPDCESCQ